MKKLYLLLLAANGLKVEAQSFTNGSMNDFDVGDTIVTMTQPYTDIVATKPPTFYYNMYFSKKYSANLDTIYYGVNQIEYTPAACSGCAKSYTTRVIYYQVTDLSASAINFTLSLAYCQFMSDTSYIDDCGYNVHVKWASSNLQTCFEPPVYVITFIEGIGVFTNKRCYNCLPTGIGSESRLLSAYKVGKVNCGKVGPLPNSIHEIITPSSISIFPNPGNGKYTFNSVTSGSWELNDIYGKTILASNFEQGKSEIDIREKSPGIYFLKCFTNQQWYVIKLMKE